MHIYSYDYLKKHCQYQLCSAIGMKVTLLFR